MLKTKSYTMMNKELTEFGVRASDLNTENMLVSQLPEKIRDEIPTLNRMGYMKQHLDEYTQAFVDYAAHSKELVLEIGCAYGFVVQEVLKNGGNIIASDLSEEHLKMVLNNTPKEHLERLFLYPAYFPKDLTLPNESVGAVLASRILHFLNGDEVGEGLGRIHNWLKKDGKFYFTAVTPYHASFRESFENVYQDRVANKEEWPGIIEDQWVINPTHKEYVEPFLNVFDIPQLEELLPKHGFKVDKISLFSYPEDTASGDIGHVGFVATKI